MIRSVLMALVLLLFYASFNVSKAEPGVVLDLASDHVDITTGFNGAPIYVYGVIDPADSELSELNLVIVIKGPEQTLIVRRKDQFMGMWMNLDSIVFKDVYGFYDLASSSPNLIDITTPQILAENDIGLNYLQYESLEGEIGDSAMQAFHEALIQSKQSRGLYALSERTVDFISGPFFRAEFRVPASVPTGEYSVTGYLFHDLKLVDQYTVNLKVGQIGFNAMVFKYSKDHSLFYGLTAILIAIIMGWSASAFLRQD